MDTEYGQESSTAIGSLSPSLLHAHTARVDCSEALPDSITHMIENALGTDTVVTRSEMTVGFGSDPEEPPIDGCPQG